jgi:hypothetical protein
MSLKIKNKDGKVIARLEDDMNEPEVDEEYKKEEKDGSDAETEEEEEEE